MIDFISTRQSTDAQTAACSRLVTAVIAQAIRDATKPLTVSEKRKECNLDLQARSAIQFLFGDSPGFSYYADLIGCSVHAIRFALTNEVEETDFAGSRAFCNADRRVIRQRLQLPL